MAEKKAKPTQTKSGKSKYNDLTAIKTKANPNRKYKRTSIGSSVNSRSKTKRARREARGR